MTDQRTEAEQRERDARIEADLAFLEELEAYNEEEVAAPIALPSLATSDLEAEIAVARALEAQKRDIAATLRAPALDYAGLNFLSNLTRGETRTFRETWPTLPTEQRRRLVQAMDERAREDLDLNFARALRVAVRDRDAGIRAAAIAALWEDRALDTLTAFLDVLERDEDATTRLAAAHALDPFAVAAAADDLPEAYANRVRETLLATATSSVEEAAVTRAATAAVGVFDDPRVFDVIEETYHAGSTADRLAALSAMGRSCNPRFLPTVQYDTEDDERDVRREATQALGEMGLSAGVPEVIARLDDEDRSVRLAAVMALGQIGDRESVRTLREHRADDPRDDWRDAVDDALAEAELGDSLI